MAAALVLQHQKVGIVHTHRAFAVGGLVFGHRVILKPILVVCVSRSGEADSHTDHEPKPRLGKHATAEVCATAAAAARGAAAPLFLPIVCDGALLLLGLRPTQTLEKKQIKDTEFGVETAKKRNVPPVFNNPVGDVENLNLGRRYANG